MQARRISDEASRILEEAKSLLASVERLGPGFESRWRAVLRPRVEEEVKRIYEILMVKVKELDWQEVVRFRFADVSDSVAKILDAGSSSKRPPDDNPELSLKETWIRGVYLEESKHYDFVPFCVGPRVARAVAANLRKEGTIPLPLRVFDNAVQELRSLIREGKLDEQLHLAAEQLIYDRMKVATIPEVG